MDYIRAPDNLPGLRQHYLQEQKRPLKYFAMLEEKRFKLNSCNKIKQAMTIKRKYTKKAQAKGNQPHSGATTNHTRPQQPQRSALQIKKNTQGYKRARGPHSLFPNLTTDFVYDMSDHSTKSSSGQQTSATGALPRRRTALTSITPSS